MDTIVVLAAAYVMGSVPFAWLLARVFYRTDLRHVGDGNVGGGNLLALGGFFPGYAAIVLDALKGLGAVLLARAVGGPGLGMLAGVVVIAGHVWPVWLRFNGGRGAAAALGVATGFFPVATGVLLGVATVALALTRRTVIALVCVMPLVPFAGVFLGGTVSEAVYIVAVFIGVGLKDAWDRTRPGRERVAAT